MGWLGVAELERENEGVVVVVHVRVNVGDQTSEEVSEALHVRVRDVLRVPLKLRDGLHDFVGVKERVRSGVTVLVSETVGVGFGVEVRVDDVDSDRLLEALDEELRSPDAVVVQVGLGVAVGLWVKVLADSDAESPLGVRVGALDRDRDSEGD